MKTTTLVCEPWMCYVLSIGSLALVGTVLFGPEGEPATKRDAKAVTKMVDAIVNRNKPPKLVERPRPSLPELVALYPENYDWKEEERVRTAIRKMLHDTTPELWEELVRRRDDPSYCVVIATEKLNDAKIRSVGYVCADLAYEGLTGVFGRHMPPWGPDGRPVSLDLDDITDLATWRKERANKSLYQLQIEVGEMTLRWLPKLKGKPKKEQDAAREAIEAELEKLKRTKQPILLMESFPRDEYLYNEKLAERAREAVRTDSRADLEIWRRGERLR
jgi:hypothetical protein